MARKANKTNKIVPEKTIKEAENKAKSIAKRNIAKDLTNDKSIANIEQSLVPIGDTPIRIRCNTIRNTRKSLARVTLLAARGTIPMERAGKLAYLLMSLGSLYRVESELSIADEIKELKALVLSKNMGIK
jgi:hypothetical protein